MRATARHHRRLAAALTFVVLAFTSCSRAPWRADSSSKVIADGMRLIEDGATQVARDRWDPAYVQQQVGREPDRLLAWVRENTDWAPYRGILRGPVGVLNDRVGNSLDRSLLLAQLLRSAGHETRLAHAELVGPRAFQLLPGLVARQGGNARGPLSMTADVSPQFVKVASENGLSAEDLNRVVVEPHKAMAVVARRLNERLADQRARLAGAAKLGDRNPDEDPLDVAVSSLRDHWWVRVRDGTSWRDLDALSPDGTAVVQSGAEFMDPAAIAESNLFQQVVVRVIAGYSHDGKRTERKVLEHVLRPADLMGQSIAIQFWPMGWFTDSVAHAELERNVRRALPQEHEFGAMLLVGQSAVAAATIEVSPEDSAKAAAVAEAGPMGGLAGSFSATMDSRQGSSRSELSGVWLEYEFQVPGETPRTVRREVFDLIGPAARAESRPAGQMDDARRMKRALALTMRTELFLVNCRLSPEYAAHMATEAVRANRDVLAALSGGKPPARERIEKLSTDAAPSVSPLVTLAVARLEWSPYARDLVVDRVGLLTRHVFTELARDSVRVRSVVDIVANDVGVVARVPDPRPVRMGQGIYDTNAETLLQSVEGTGNAGDALAASRNWVPIAPGDTSAVDALHLQDDVRRRIKTELAAGNAVLAPSSEVSVGNATFSGWWSLDPRTGTTLGYGSTGWGQATEDAFLRARAAGPAAYYRLLAREAGKRFAAAWAHTSFWCYAGAEFMEFEGKSGPVTLRRVKTTIVESSSECQGAAISMGLITGVLPVMLMHMEIVALERAGGVLVGTGTGGVGNAVKPNSPRTPPKTVPGDPGSEGTQPQMPKVPPKTVPGDPGSEGTQPQMQAPKTPPKTVPGNPETEGTAQQKAVPPEGKGIPGEDEPIPPTERQPNQPLPKTRPEAEKAWGDAKRTEQEATQSSQQATEDYVKYQANSPRKVESGSGGDPGKYDPAEAQRLEQKMLDAQRRSVDATNEEAAQRLNMNNLRIKDGLEPIRPPKPGAAPAPRPQVSCPPDCGGSDPTLLQQAPSGAMNQAAGVAKAISKLDF